MNIRKATIEDAEILFNWRNNLDTRLASHTNDELSFDAHRAWLELSLKNPMRCLLIAEEAGKAIGTVRIDQHNDAAYLSWTVAPEARGRGVAKQMVKKVVEEMAGTQAVRAEVKEGNISSVKVAKDAGMKLVQHENGVLHFLREPANR